MAWMKCYTSSRKKGSVILRHVDSFRKGVIEDVLDVNVKS